MGPSASRVLRKENRLVSRWKPAPAARTATKMAVVVGWVTVARNISSASAERAPHDVLAGPMNGRVRARMYRHMMLSM